MFCLFSQLFSCGEIVAECIMCTMELMCIDLHCVRLTFKVLVTDAQWEGMGDVGSARYEPALLPPCPTIRVLSYSN